MKKILFFAFIFTLVLTACGSEKGIETHNAWMRPIAKGETGGVYFELHNHGSESDELLSVTTDVADSAEIHESKMEGDVMKMNMLTSLPIDGFADVAFKPGGLHVMLVHVNKDFKVNDEFVIVLHFKTHEDITVHVIVKDTEPTDEDHDM
jgi:periplasmic copper chaperone A